MANKKGVPDDEAYEKQLHGDVRAGKGAAESFIASGIQTVSNVTAAMVNVASHSAIYAVFAGVLARLVLELARHGVLQHHVACIYRFRRVVEQECGSASPNPAAVAEAFRHAMGALDEAVFPALGKLVAQYPAGTKPDAFFRGTGQLLASLDESGMLSTTTLLTALDDELQEATDADGIGTYLCFQPEETSANGVTLEVGWGSAGSAAFHGPVAMSATHRDRWPEICRRMATAELVSGPNGRLTFPRFWAKPVTIRRLLTIICA